MSAEATTTDSSAVHVRTGRLMLTDEQSRRITQSLAADFRSLFRVARRLGLDRAIAEEAVQEAFLVFAQRIEHVNVGKERAFLLGTVARIAANLRRAAHRRHEVPFDPSWVEVGSAEPSAATKLEDLQARNLLDCVLSKLAPELREVFVLYEIEQLTMVEVGETLGIKTGTVGSRLHRARQTFDCVMRRLVKTPNRLGSSNERP